MHNATVSKSNKWLGQLRSKFLKPRGSGVSNDVESRVNGVQPVASECKTAITPQKTSKHRLGSVKVAYFGAKINQIVP